MTILQELTALYDARADDAGWPRPGFSNEKISAVVVLAEDGSVTAIRSLMAPNAKGKLEARRMSVPSVGRTSGIKPATFWDKTAYALGITMTEDGPGQRKRTAKEHAAFKADNLALIEAVDDPELAIFAAFCRTWDPTHFANFPEAVDLVDANVVFRVGSGRFLHDLPAARNLLPTSGDGGAMCLVSGRTGPVARLHPMIKGVMGAQTAGASLVSFNSDAYESHGKKQGDNAPVSDTAAFAYSTALNALLARGSGNSLRIGDAAVTFWADDSGAEDAMAAALGMDRSTDDEPRLREAVIAVAEGRVPPDVTFDPATRVFVLGLSPNAARLSVRFWYPGNLGDFARSVARFWAECAITPSPFAKGGVEYTPKPWALLYDLAAQRDERNIPHGTGGDLMRAILAGARYPATLLPALLRRLRVEGDPDRVHGNLDGRRAAMIRAVLFRNHGREVPMALDEQADDAAYLLGRLFGAYVYAERSYQDRNAGLRQKYMGAASATPARVYPVLMRGYEHNMDALRKAGGMKAASGVKADRAVAAIIALLPGDGALPASLSLEDQGRFFIGFYHQLSAFYEKSADAAETLIEETAE